MQKIISLFQKQDLFRTFLFILFAIVMGLVFERFLVNNHLQDQQIEATGQLANIKSNIESAVNLNLNLVEGLSAYIAANPDLTHQEFAKYAAVIVDKNPALRNIAAAPGLVIRYMHPIEGNEAAIGLDYNKNEKQKSAALSAVEKNATIIAGPLELVQGGIAFISRTPVFIKSENADHQNQLWGLISSVLDSDKFYALAGLNNENLDLIVAIRGRDSLGKTGEVFYGDPTLFNKNTVNSSIQLPYGSWYMVAQPKRGWNEDYRGKTLFRIFFVLTLLIISYLLIINKLHQFERVKAEQSAQQANIQKQMAQQASEIKSRFLANMSHELRTPMHAILSFSNLGLKRVEDPKVKGYLEKINTSSTRLTKLIDDLLDLSKLESGKLIPNFEENNITETVLEAIDEISSIANEKKIAIDVNTDKPLIGQFDKSLILRVIINTISNAIKFSENGGRIEIILNQEKTSSTNMLTYAIVDQGVGIPKNELTDIFDSFVQSSKTRYQTGGTGLGLPISQEIIQLHHGEIWAESPPGDQGSGSVIKFNIPVKSPNSA